MTDREKIFLEDGYLCYAKGKTVADQRSVLPKNAKAKIRVKCGTKKKIVNVTVSKKK